MVVPEEIKRKRKEDIINGMKAYGLSIVNMMLCWFNFTMTRLAGIFITKYYVALIYPQLQRKNELSSIGGITQLNDLITTVLSMVLCMIFVFWVWYRYESVTKRGGSLLKEFATITSWQMMEIALAGIILFGFNYLLVHGESSLIQTMIGQYSQELLISAACLVLGAAGIIGGTIIRKRTVNYNT